MIKSHHRLQKSLSKVEEMLQKLIEHGNREPTESHMHIPANRTTVDKSGGNSNPPRTFDHCRAHRMDFPKFSSKNPAVWLRKCKKYFMMNQFNDWERVVIAGIYMEGSVEHWYIDNVEGIEIIGWEKFVELLLLRFSSM